MSKEPEELGIIIAEPHVDSITGNGAAVMRQYRDMENR